MTLTVRDVDRSSYPTQCRVSSDSTRTLVNRVLCECVHSSLCSHHWGGLLLFLLKRAHARPHWPRLCASMRERIQGAASGCYKECGRQLVRVIACRGRWTRGLMSLSCSSCLSISACRARRCSPHNPPTVCCGDTNRPTAQRLAWAKNGYLLDKR